MDAFPFGTVMGLGAAEVEIPWPANEGMPSFLLEVNGVESVVCSCNLVGGGGIFSGFTEERNVFIEHGIILTINRSWFF